MLDERNNRLLLQFQACADNLVVQSGVLGLLRSAGKTAPQIAAAVHQAVRNMCTRRALHPRCNSLRSGEAVAGSADEPLVEQTWRQAAPNCSGWEGRLSGAGRGGAPRHSLKEFGGRLDRNPVCKNR